MSPENRSLNLEIPNQFLYTAVVREFVEHLARRAGLPANRVNELMIVSDEIVNNAIEHGSPIGRASSIAVHMDYDEKRFRMEVKDPGIGSKKGTPRPESPIRQVIGGFKRGRGLYLIEALVDKFELEIDDEKGSTAVIEVATHAFE